MQRGTVGFRSDEMQVVANNWDQQRYADWERWNDVAPAPTTNQLDWGGFYNVIFIANHVIENQKQITEGTPAEIDQLAAEAY
ncbi:RagB/SusD family nutrient uptake outer membrane protein, partial [Neokomagataea anthophila]